VIAGAPNVGKSLLVTRISTAKPKVAVYPFTTQEISVGTFQRRYIRYQVIDTPGLLDRDLSERNPMELRAILALRHLADMVVFMLDPTETCGYSFVQQEHLLASIQNEFPGIPLVVVENKVDLLRSDRNRLKVSASTGKGVAELVDRIVRTLSPQQRL
jgi:nucleolar GTP-binding protein